MAQVIALPVARVPEPDPEQVDNTGVSAEPGSVSERAERAARAVDECAGEVEDLLRVARELRAEWLAGREPDMQVALLAVTTRLAAIANVLGETHADLDEISNETTGGGAA
ncbi:hypothetical protein [Pseudonocardia sp. ICBG1142]|uniref:hypothetical protein n=1 Tax=Pseudonocardia sp. ICBG1142 TaxID=2846760 RepID=UPI001CF662B6|nr:hypothetical protein [Pseudonocardia sp. ICBG1142]